MVDPRTMAGGGGGGCVFPDYLRDACAAVLSDELIDILATDLQIHAYQLANKLGFSKDIVLTDGLFWWREHPGSTVHVLVCILANLRRSDCIDKVLADMAEHTMQLYLKIEHTYGDCGRTFNPQFKQITTNTEFTLGQALENILEGELEHYQIIGPGMWVQWATLAKELKGQQLTLLYQPPNENTEIKRTIPFLSNYSRQEVSNLLNLERDHTKIDNLKLVATDQSPFSSVKSDSNNVTTECDFSVNMSLFNNKSSSLTLSLSSLENNVDEFTETKTPQVINYTASNQETPLVTYNSTSSQLTPLATINTTSSQLTKTFRDKCVYNDEACDPSNLLSQVVPNFSIIEKDDVVATDEVEVDSHQNEVKQNNLSCNYQYHLPANNSYSDEEDWGQNYLQNTRWVVFPNKIELGINIGSLDTLPPLDSLLPQPMAPQQTVTTSNDAVDTEYVTHSFIEAVYGRSPSISMARRSLIISHQDSNSLLDDLPSQKQFERELPDQLTRQQSFKRHLNESGEMMPQTESGFDAEASWETQGKEYYRYTPPPPHHPANLPQFIDRPHEKFSHHGNTTLISDGRNTSQGRIEHYMAMNGHSTFSQAIAKQHIFSKQPDIADHNKATHARHNSVSFPVNTSSIFTRNMPGLRNSEHSSSGYRTNESVTFTPIGVSIRDSQHNSHFDIHEPIDIFRLSHPTHDALGQPLKCSLNNKPKMIKSYSSDDAQGCSYIDPTRQVSHIKSVKVEDELTHIEGWKPKENGDTILKTMEPYRNQDGVYVLWKSRRHQNFVLTVSHQQQYIHLRVNECTQNKKKIFYIYENGFCSDSLLELINHYKINGIKVKVSALGGTKIHKEHIILRKTIR